MPVLYVPERILIISDVPVSVHCDTRSLPPFQRIPLYLAPELSLDGRSFVVEKLEDTPVGFAV